ncbi:helicase-associated domain-containing protein [Thermoactinomyces sp. AMNI-1]|uniref:DNA 3'-5' helicase n=2 Tax=Thermoactinomyces mirandus TaxID=2756294 RepID=A0A7W1XQG1_9BACL|nr:helicase-associated domain-containing protein [Thermoactinomyces mirandus]
MVMRNGTILVEKWNTGPASVLQMLDYFARRLKETDHLYTYQLDEYTLWQAAASGIHPDFLVGWLKKYARFPLDSGFVQQIRKNMERFGMVRLEKYNEQSFLLHSMKKSIIERISQIPGLMEEVLHLDRNNLVLPMKYRGRIKEQCVKWGYPPVDEIGYSEGEYLHFRLRKHSSFSGLRTYQQKAVQTFCHPAQRWLSSGVILLPCGSGKTVVAIAIMGKIGKETLILTPNTISCKQWVRELRDKTDLPRESIGEYTAEKKQIAPVTVTTYQMMTKRDSKTGIFPHLRVFGERNWGLIIYDEVHLLPAPIFRVTADLQAKRRLGLTAALVREDGREKDVFTLIGPVIFSSLWKEMESAGWIAEAVCQEVRVSFPAGQKEIYQAAEKRHQYRLAAENPLKMEVLEELLARHRGEQILVIGQYIDQLKKIAARLGYPLITGATPQAEREKWYQQFREKKISVLLVSKVANMAVDLPDASVAIQVSGTFGSRQEEAQRLGRVLRPKQTGHKAYFYQLVTKESVDQEYAWRRQAFLREQGYRYQVLEWGG